MTWVVYPEHEGGPWMQFCFDGPAVNGVQPRHVLVDTPIVAGIAAQMEAVAAVLRPLEIAP